MRVFDSIRENQEKRACRRVDPITLSRAKNAWDSLSQFRKDADRCTRFVFGDQWSDIVTDSKGRQVTEEQLILEEGYAPITNNRISSMIRSILWKFSENQTEPVCSARNNEDKSVGEMLSYTIQAVYQNNRLWELDRRMLEQFVITGLAAYRSYYGWDYELDQSDVWCDPVSHKRIFFHGYNEDPRCKGLDLIGEIHDLPLWDIVSKFSQGSPEEAAKIRDVYNIPSESEWLANSYQELTGERAERVDFFTNLERETCRVIEVWTKESRERLLCHDYLSGETFLAELSDLDRLRNENKYREEEQLKAGVDPNSLKLIDIKYIVDRYWAYHYLTPTGHVLAEGESPYSHRSHPYTIKIHSFFNGRCRSYTSDCLDIQKHINRLMMMEDLSLRSAAKGMLLIAEEAIPDGMTIEDVASEWRRHNGVVKYKHRPGVPAPQQVYSNGSATGISNLLNTQLRMFDDISGVSSALQGQRANSNTPASLYAMQAQNSSNMLVDLMESFRQCREDRDLKHLKLVLQYYDEDRYIGVVGNTSKDVLKYSPDKVNGIVFDLSLSESTSSSIYRSMQNDFLMQLFQMGAIDTRTLLENSTLAFSDRLLQSVDKQEERQREAARMAQEEAQNVQMQGAQPLPEQPIVSQ